LSEAVGELAGWWEFHQDLDDAGMSSGGANQGSSHPGRDQFGALRQFVGPALLSPVQQDLQLPWPGLTALLIE
jgi:hypothetical protein